MRLGQIDLNARVQNANRNVVIPAAPMDMSLVGVLHKDLTDRTTTGTAAEVIKNIQLEANALRHNGDGLRYSISGVTAVNANNKLVTVVWGSTEVYNSAVVAANNKPWGVVVEIHRVTSALQRVVSRAACWNAALVADQYTNAAENCLAALNLAVKVTDSTAAAGTTLKTAVLEALSKEL